MLFPGISTIQTRARYFLFVPWIVRHAERSGRTGPAFRQRVERDERRLITALRKADDQRGLIGRVAGETVKTLPSTIYWNGMVRLGILRSDLSLDQLGGGRRTNAANLEDAVTELVDRATGHWHPTLPDPPGDFFPIEHAELAMRQEEAEWLKERMLDAAPGTLLALLLERGERPDPSSTLPWDDPTCHDLPPHLDHIVTQARRFSTVMHGAMILYNLLLAERCGKLGIEDKAALADEYRERLDAWTAELDDPSLGIRTWDLDEFWTLIDAQQPHLELDQRQFVDEWITRTQRLDGGAIVKDKDLAELVRRQERSRKRAQARLYNDAAARQWGGTSGMARLSYRWPVARDQIIDICDGLESP